MPRTHRPRRSPVPFRSCLADALEPRLLLAINPATLVKDINVVPAAVSAANPHSFIAFKGLTYFRATQGDYGTEWFRTDGTASGTSLLADINPGAGSSFPAPNRGESIPKEITTAAVVGDTLFFTAYRPDVGSELWKTDGTAAGTVLVKDIRPGTGSGKPLWLIPVGDTLFFSAEDANLARQIWKSDGTPEGTQKVTNFPTGAGSIDPYPLAAVGGRLLFAGDTPDAGDVHGLELWSTDGTAAGTKLVKNINPAGGSNPGYQGSRDAPVVVSNGELYFTATDAAHGKELWKSDGTAAGTVLVADVAAGAGSSSPGALTDVNGSLYFVAVAPGGREVFRRDPASGTVSPVGAVSLNFPFASTGNVGGVFYIVANHNNRAALYRHDPANPGAGLALVTDLPAGTSPVIEPGPILDLNGAAVFIVTGPSGDDRVQLWRSDGTAAGTTRLDSFAEGPFPDENQFARVRLARGANGLAYLGERAVGGTSQPYRTDGTPAGSGWLDDVDFRTLSSYPGPFVDLAGAGGGGGGAPGGRAVFFATDQAHGREPWVTDGTPGGTVLLKDVFPGPSGSSRTGGVLSPVLDGRTYFDARSTDAEFGLELWATDGTPAGTVRVKDFGAVPGAGITNYAALEGKLYFVVGGSFGSGTRGVWVTDGTEAGTRLVASEEGDIPGPLVAYNGSLYYVAYSPGRGAEMWKTDGTPAGTARVLPLSASATPQRGAAAVVDGVLYFLAPSPAGAAALWRSDGTAGGTSVVKDVPEGVTRVAPAAHRLVLSSGGTGQPEPTLLWVSDGTAAGTRPLSELVPELAGFTGDRLTFEAPQLTATAGTVYFFGASAAAIPQVWQTDGTAAGTHLVKSFFNNNVRGVESLGVVDGLVYFNVRDDSPVKQMWRTAGTEATTHKVVDMTSGFPTASGDRIYFAGARYDVGTELWSIPRSPAAAYVFYNNSAFDYFSPGAIQNDIEAIAPDKAPLLPGQTPSFANVTSYDKGVNGVFIDLLGDRPGLSSVDDFRVERSDDGATWTWAPSASLERIPAPNGTAFTRYDLIFLDGWFANAWLRVTALANSSTGLSTPAVFVFGNLVGDATGDGRVDALDLAATRRLLNTAATTATAADFNRDGRVNALDLAIVKRNANKSLAAPAPPGPGPFATGVPTPLRAAGLFGDRREGEVAALLA